jgi:hypothetical protein
MPLDGYSTHQPPLAACVMATQGPVLEIGAGLYSTPLLHALCGAAGRALVTVEADARWAGRFKALEAPWHRVVAQDLPGTPEPLADTPWSVVLVDGTTLSRRPWLATLANAAELLVVHDSQEIKGYGYDILADFAHRWTWQAKPLQGFGLCPWTTVVSNMMDVGFLRELLG